MWLFLVGGVCKKKEYIYIYYTSGTHAQAHTRLKIAGEQHRMMEVGVGGGGGGGRCEERVEVEMEMGDGK